MEDIVTCSLHTTFLQSIAIVIYIFREYEII